jgi:hypothetical protein
MLLDTLARESGVPTGGIDGNEAAVRCHHERRSDEPRTHCRGGRSFIAEIFFS